MGNLEASLSLEPNRSGADTEINAFFGISSMMLVLVLRSWIKVNFNFAHCDT